MTAIVPSDHEHQWQDTGFADLDECAVEGCRLTRSTTTGEVIDPDEIGAA